MASVHGFWCSRRLERPTRRGVGSAMPWNPSACNGAMGSFMDLRRCKRAPRSSEILQFTQPGYVPTIEMSLHGEDGPAEDETLVRPAAWHRCCNGFTEQEAAQAHGGMVLCQHLARAHTFEELKAFGRINLVIKQFLIEKGYTQ